VKLLWIQNPVGSRDHGEDEGGGGGRGKKKREEGCSVQILPISPLLNYFFNTKSFSLACVPLFGKQTLSWEEEEEEEELLLLLLLLLLEQICGNYFLWVSIRR
jgi:hypothetical protein